MTEPSTLQDRLIAQFDAMPPQMQIAAKHLIDHPQDVALMSMRDLARRAGVSPATMTRLAQFLGASGYEDLRHEQAETIRRGEGFAARALATPHGAPETLAQQVLEELARHVATLTQPETLASIAAAARALSGARRVFVLGARSCHAIAWHFHYVMSLLGERTRHLDGPGGTGPDALMRAQPGKFKVVGKVGEPRYLAWVTHPDNVDLRDYLNGVIGELADSGKLSEWQQEWFGFTMDLPADGYLPEGAL